MKVVFLDRDGVINIDNHYVYKWEDFEFTPFAINAMKDLKSSGFKLIIITNQSGIARGYYTEEDLFELNNKMKDYLKNYGVDILDIYYCPHLPNAKLLRYAINCECRKPKPGMIKKAALDYNIDLKSSFLIGDKMSDIRAAELAGVGKALLIDKTQKIYKNFNLKHEMIFPNIKACSEYIISKNI